GTGLPGVGPPPFGGPGQPELNLRISVSPPRPATGSALTQSPTLERLLAARLQVTTDRVRVLVRDMSNGKAGPGPAAGPPRGQWSDPLLHEGFLAAYLQDDRLWHVAESVVPGFPNEFQRQAMWLSAIGLLLLLPLAWLFSRALVAPIQRFSVASQ